MAVPAFRDRSLSLDFADRPRPDGVPAGGDDADLRLLPFLPGGAESVRHRLPGRPLEQAIVFPMAVVPNAWGVWNMAHLALRSRRRIPLAVHGSLLPLLLMPFGIALACAFDLFTLQMQFALPRVPIGMGVYYLAWKFLVGFLNEEIGIA